jgi:hypothetical protein
VSSTIRERLTPANRAAELKHTIDVGFVNRRAVDTLVGDRVVANIDNAIRGLPPMAEALREIRIDRIYTRVMLDFCEVHSIKSLAEVLASEKGHLFCSTETLQRIKTVYDAERVSTFVTTPGVKRRRVRLDFSTKHIWASTLKSELHRGAWRFSLIAQFHRNENDVLVFHPLVIGSPWLVSDDPRWEDYAMFWRGSFFEHFVEDFDEFARVTDTPKPESQEPMRHISERAFKLCLAELLGDPVVNDWGGETSDHFTAHLHLQGRRVTGAFLLKGPAQFKPMTPRHLGKNGDQIYRLATEPAEVLFVQHSHEITPAVRETLRAFAVQPSRARRYCLIDGRDSLWLLRAYGLYEKALALSKTTD